jgi:hypothetical protein
MWRYLDGVSNPSVKRKDTCRKDYFSDYEKKRARNFSLKWTENLEWLANTDEGIVCNWCRKHSADHDSKSSFIKGCQSYKIDAIVKHEESKVHIRSREIEKQLVTPIQKSDAANILMTLNQNNSEKLGRMIRTCHALVMNNRPISDCLWLNYLDEKKGLDVGTENHVNSSLAQYQKLNLKEFQLQ